MSTHEKTSCSIRRSPVNDGERIRLTTLTDKGG